MTDLKVALCSIHVVAACAFLMAAVLPLGMAGAEERAERRNEGQEPDDSMRLLGTCIDLWLILQDVLPVLWLFQAIREAPADVSAARRKWNEESSVRLCFWVATALMLTFPLYFIRASP